MVYHVPNLVSYQMFTTSQQYCLYLGTVSNKMFNNTIFGHMHFKDKLGTFHRKFSRQFTYTSYLERNC